MVFMALAYDSNMANNNDLHSDSLSISDKVISRIYVRCRAQNNHFLLKDMLQFIPRENDKCRVTVDADTRRSSS